MGKVGVNTQYAVEIRLSVYLLLGVTVWLGMIVWAPYARSQNWISAEPVYYSFGLICHQLVERSFVTFGNPLPICHRCCGLYLGVWAGLILLPILPKAARQILRRPRMILWFWLPMGIDLIIHNTGGSRFVTGFLASLPLAPLLQAAWNQFPARRQLRQSTGKANPWPLKNLRDWRRFS